MLYIGSSLMVFDFSEPAYKFDEEQRAGILVALGPRPQQAFTQSYHGDGHFTRRRVAVSSVCADLRLVEGIARLRSTQKKGTPPPVVRSKEWLPKRGKIQAL